MQSAEVRAFAENALRFEASVLSRMLQRLGIPRLVSEFLIMQKIIKVIWLKRYGRKHLSMYLPHWGMKKWQYLMMKKY